MRSQLQPLRLTGGSPQQASSFSAEPHITWSRSSLHSYIRLSTSARASCALGRVRDRAPLSHAPEGARRHTCAYCRPCRRVRVYVFVCMWACLCRGVCSLLCSHSPACTNMPGRRLRYARPICSRVEPTATPCRRLVIPRAPVTRGREKGEGAGCPPKTAHFKPPPPPTACSVPSRLACWRSRFFWKSKGVDVAAAWRPSPLSPGARAPPLPLCVPSHLQRCMYVPGSGMTMRGPMTVGCLDRSPRRSCFSRLVRLPRS